MEVVTKWIQVAQQLQTLRSYNMFIAVMFGIQSLDFYEMPSEQTLLMDLLDEIQKDPPLFQVYEALKLLAHPEQAQKGFPRGARPNDVSHEFFCSSVLTRLKRIINRLV